MKSDVENMVGRDAISLFTFLGKINECMIAIRAALGSNAAVCTATRGCDIRKYKDFMQEEEEYTFESYVEAETINDDLIGWFLDIRLTSSGWRYHTHIGKHTKDGEQVLDEFSDLSFQSVGDLTNNALVLTNEFVMSAINFKI
jgi:hypothetical protein